MQKLVFICGLHRSGTSILHKTLSSSKHISGFHDTGIFEDEGQHLQSVYPPDMDFGGPGKFAFDKNSRLDENSNLISLKNREKLLSEWGKYWDKQKPIWIEKSPPNLIRMSFLQELFPEAYFITISRHPIVVSLATKKWSKTPIDNLIEHWVTAHQIYQNDRGKIQNELFFSYEEMVEFPEKVIKEVEDFLETDISFFNNFKNYNGKYFDLWNEDKIWQFIKKKKKKKSIQKYENSVNELGYSLLDFEKYPRLRLNKKM